MATCPVTRLACPQDCAARWWPGIRPIHLACVLLRSARLPGWDAFAGIDSAVLWSHALHFFPRAVPSRREHAGVNPHARTACPVYRLALHGDGFNPRQTLLITATGYFLFGFLKTRGTRLDRLAPIAAVCCCDELSYPWVMIVAIPSGNLFS